MQRQLSPLKPRQLVHVAVQEAIKSYIVENALGPGSSVLTEVELAKRLGVSRNSVREAVKALEVIGLIEARPGAGLFVRDFSLDSILDQLPYALHLELKRIADVLEVRLQLEHGMAERIAAAADDDQLRELHAILDRLRAAAAEGRYLPDEDRAFHNTLLGKVDNPVVSKVVDIFWTLFHHLAERSAIPDPADPMQTYEVHVPIVEALERHDAAALQEAIRNHYIGVERRIQAASSAQDVATKP
jgi:DNA-binding FadR family transcriptional regulator